MKKTKKIITLVLVALLIGAISLTAFAETQYKTPSEIVAAITGRTLESVVEEKEESNKTYGKIASEAGKLDEFKQGMLEIKKAKIAELVANGKITQEEADEIIKTIEEQQANCDADGSAKIGQKLGLKLGFKGAGLGNGMGRGQGLGKGMGRNQNNGCGMGTCGLK